MPLESPEQIAHAYLWMGSNGYDFHVGKLARDINGTVISDFFHDIICDTTFHSYLMKHSHTGELEWVQEDKLLYYYGDKKHPEPVIPCTPSSNPASTTAT